MSVIIDIKHSHYTTNGQRFRVDLDGETIVKSSRSPEHDAARELVRRGVTGRLQWRWCGSPVIAGEGLIAVLATQTVTEGQTITPRIARWSEHWAAEAAE